MYKPNPFIPMLHLSSLAQRSTLQLNVLPPTPSAMTMVSCFLGDVGQKQVVWCSQHSPVSSQGTPLRNAIMWLRLKLETSSLPPEVVFLFEESIRHLEAVMTCHVQPYETPNKIPKRTKRLYVDKECLHCHTHQTSQWRSGPEGSSTYVGHSLPTSLL